MCVLLGLVLLRISHSGAGVSGQGSNPCLFTCPFPPLFLPPIFTISGVENINCFGHEAKSLQNRRPTIPGVQYQFVFLRRPHKQKNKQTLAKIKAIYHFKKLWLFRQISWHFFPFESIFENSHFSVKDQCYSYDHFKEISNRESRG